MFVRDALIQFHWLNKAVFRQSGLCFIIWQCLFPPSLISIYSSVDQKQTQTALHSAEPKASLSSLPPSPSLPSPRSPGFCSVTTWGGDVWENLSPVEALVWGPQQPPGQSNPWLISSDERLHRLGHLHLITIYVKITQHQHKWECVQIKSSALFKFDVISYYERILQA